MARSRSESVTNPSTSSPWLPCSIPARCESTPRASAASSGRVIRSDDSTVHGERQDRAERPCGVRLRVVLPVRSFGPINPLAHRFRSRLDEIIERFDVRLHDRSGKEYPVLEEALAMAVDLSRGSGDRLGPALAGEIGRREADHDVLGTSPLDSRRRPVGFDHQIHEIGRESLVIRVAECQEDRADQRIVRCLEFERLQIDDVIGLPGDRDIPRLDDRSDVGRLVVPAGPPPHLDRPGAIGVVAHEDG